MNIKKVVVIGSGIMGSGIAAQLCNANIPVTLLDLKTEISEKAKKRIFESRPPLLIDKSKINNIRAGNIEENFDLVKKADWVVEAVVEKIDIKHNIYEKILEVKPNHFLALGNLGIIFSQLKEFNKAVELFERTIEINPEYAQGYNNLGNALFELSEFDKPNPVVALP